MCNCRLTVHRPGQQRGAGAGVCQSHERRSEGVSPRGGVGEVGRGESDANGVLQLSEVRDGVAGNRRRKTSRGITIARREGGFAPRRIVRDNHGSGSQMIAGQCAEALSPLAAVSRSEVDRGGSAGARSPSRARSRSDQ